MSDIYKQASRMNLRFQTTLGALTVEDLWNLPLQSARSSANLDDISRAIHKQLKNDDDFSLVDKDKKSDARIQLQFDIIKDIIETRLVERNAREKERAEAERRQKIMGIIEEKKNNDLQNMPLEELEKLLSEGSSQ